MSLRLEMLQVARLAPNLLAEAAPRVRAFLEGELNEDGGASDRAGKSDLYYTAFALDALIAMQSPLPRDEVARYLTRFGAGEELDLIHKACLVRCWAALGDKARLAGLAYQMLDEVERHRSADGSYAIDVGSEHGTLYYAFLALGLYQDLGKAVPDGRALGESFESLRTDDGAYANASDLKWGTTPSTAAAAAALVQLGMPVPKEVGPWLLAQQHEQGGFKAMPAAPMPDLLSTATALHALSALRVPIGAGCEPALDFIDTLWSGHSFYGHWGDDAQDCEYAFYALLALGHLSLAK